MRLTKWYIISPNLGVGLSASGVIKGWTRWLYRNLNMNRNRKTALVWFYLIFEKSQYRSLEVASESLVNCHSTTCKVKHQPSPHYWLIPLRPSIKNGMSKGCKQGVFCTWALICAWIEVDSVLPLVGYYCPISWGNTKTYLGCSCTRPPDLTSNVQYRTQSRPVQAHTLSLEGLWWPKIERDVDMSKSDCFRVNHDSAPLVRSVYGICRSLQKQHRSQ